MDLRDFQAANAPTVNDPLSRFAAVPSFTPMGGGTMGIASPRQQAEAQRIRRSVQNNVFTPVAQAVTDPYYAATLGQDQRRQDARKRILEKVAQATTDPMMATFAGVNAKLADKGALAKSLEMKAAGVADREIWKETGWTHAFPDGKARFEIPDNPVALSHDTATRYNSEYGSKMGQEYQHPGLYANYPEMADIPADIRNHGIPFKSQGGAGSLSTDAFTGKPKLFASGGPNDINGVVGHELQHAVQDTEGFATGGNPNEFRFSRQQPKIYERYMDVGKELGQRYLELGKSGVTDFANDPTIARLAAEKAGYEKTFPQLLLSPSQQYESLAGEVEARLTQRRMDLNAAQRRERYPLDDMDVKPEDQIVRFK